MKRADYVARGRDAYACGRVLIMPSRQPSWQRAAFRYGYMQAREEWRAAHPRASELDASARRARAYCRAMVRQTRARPLRERTEALT